MKSTLNPQTGELPTALDADFFDSVQEEIAGVIEVTGVALDKTKRNQLVTALKKLFLQSGNNLSEIKTQGAAAVAAALSNLGIGSAGNRVVGSGLNQIPDMSFFSMSITGTFPTLSGYQKLPSGLIIQWGLVTTSNGIGTATFPIAFPNSVFRVVTCEPSANSWGTSNATFHGPANITNNGFTARTITSTGSTLTLANSGSQWVALGY